MGICPRCGSWVDEGEPYCPECCYDGSGNGTAQENPIFDNPNVVTINGSDYDIDDVEEALEELGYDLDDLKLGLVDIYELEEILERY